MRKLILLVLLSPVLIGCPEELMETSYSFIVKNNSSHSIAVYRAYGKALGELGLTAYPDTSLPISDKYVDVNPIKSGEFVDFSPTQSWEETFKKLPADTLSIFIFHTDTLKKYSWQEVRDGYKVFKRYDLSLEDIKRMNYTITYP